MNKNRGRPIKLDPPVPAKGSRLTPTKLIGTISKSLNGGGYQVWKCRCTCGETCVVLRQRIKNGLTKSCGCLRKEMAQARVMKARAVYSEQCRQRRLANG